MSRPGRASAQPIIIKPSRTAADSSKGASALSLAVTEPINGKLTNAVGHEGTLRQPAPLLIKRINIGGKHTHSHTEAPTHLHPLVRTHTPCHTHASTYILPHFHFHIHTSAYTYPPPLHAHIHTFIHRPITLDKLKA